MNGQLLPLLDTATLRFDPTSVFLNRSKRFILPVPDFGDGGEELVVPEGFPHAGAPIYDPGDRGIRVFNAKDRLWVGARGDGKELIVLNDITPAQAAGLLTLVTDLGFPQRELTFEDLQRLIVHAEEKLGVNDRYAKKRSRLTQHRRLEPILTLASGDPVPHFGYMEVASDTEHHAVYLRRPFRIDSGPVPQFYPEGGIVVTDGKNRWGVEPGVFMRNWVRKDRSKEILLASLDDVPAENPQRRIAVGT